MQSNRPSPPRHLRPVPEANPEPSSSQSGTRRACRVWELSDYVGDWTMCGPADVRWYYEAFDRVIARKVARNNDITRIEASGEITAVIPRYGDCAPLALALSGGVLTLAANVPCVDAHGTRFEVVSTRIEMRSFDAADFTMTLVLHSARAGDVHVTTQVKIARTGGAHDLFE